jgi:hypothetical protein
MLLALFTAVRRLRRRSPKTPVVSHPRRFAAALEAADTLHAATGWDHEHLLERTLEDTCHEHGRFCCPDCFACS